MIEFCKVCGKKTDWFDMPKEKKDAILDCFRDLQKSNLHFINQKEDHYQMVLKVIIIFRM